MKISPRPLVWVNLLLLALVAYWGAATVSTAIAAKLTPPPEVHLNPPPAPIKVEPHRPSSFYASISNRDIFNSVKPEPEKPPAPPPPTECKLKLWGVSVNINGASYSVIEDLVTHKQDLFRVNEKAGGCTIKAVELDRVILDRGGQDEILKRAQPAGGTGIPRPAPAVAAAPAPGEQV